MPRLRHFLSISLLTIVACRHEVASSAAAQWLALPAELQGEVQGMPPHWSVQGTGGAVSSANALATAAGIEILRQGGNAIDALLAVQWVLAVVEPQSSGLGGGGFLVYYDAGNKKATALDGREEQPGNAGADLFLGNDKKPLPFSERIAGARAVGVPGTVALMDYAWRKLGSGRISWQATLERAITLARYGIRVSPRLAQAMALNRKRLLQQNGDGSAYLRSGAAYLPGETFYQQELAGTLQVLARQGAAEFYSGAIARDIIATVGTNQVYRSAMIAEDLAGYRVAERPVEQALVAGATVYSVGPPASGATVLRMLNDAPRRQSTDQELIISLLRSGRAAFALREKNLEDPDFAAAHQPGNSPAGAQNTTHISVIDAQGNVASCTSSVETGMGSALVVRGRGFLLNNQLSDFDALPGKVNSPEQGKRLRRTALNAEARTLGGKRPRSSMSPLIIRFPDGRTVALGSPGGPTIVGTVALTAARLLKGAELQDALNAPRALMMPHGKALVELPLRRDAAFMRALAAGGIQADLRRTIISLGSVQAVQCTPSWCVAASDLRREGLGLVRDIRVE